MTFAGALEAAPSADTTAHDVLEAVRAEMLQALQDPDVRNNAGEVNALVERVLLPHIDMQTASRLVLGNHWKSLNAEQQPIFVDEFERYLVRFYAEALAGYVKAREIPGDFMALEAGQGTEGSSQIVIESRVYQPNGDTIPVAYRLINRGTWRVIDVSVNGISMARLYRAQFAPVVKRDGIDGLLTQLRQRNAAYAAP